MIKVTDELQHGCWVEASNRELGIIKWGTCILLPAHHDPCAESPATQSQQESSE